jgi:hypothetical protein
MTVVTAITFFWSFTRNPAICVVQLSFSVARGRYDMPPSRGVMAPSVRLSGPGH